MNARSRLRIWHLLLVNLVVALLATVARHREGRVFLVVTGMVLFAIPGWVYLRERGPVVIHDLEEWTKTLPPVVRWPVFGLGLIGFGFGLALLVGFLMLVMLTVSTWILHRC